MLETNIFDNYDIFPEKIKGEIFQQIIILIINMIISFIGNITVIGIILMTQKHNKKQSPTTMFVLSLAFSDLIVSCLCLSIKLFEYLSDKWTLGNITCKLVMYIHIVSVMSSVFLMLGMAYDRYVAICQPMKFANSVSRTKRMIISAWIIAFFLAVPEWVIFCEIQINRFNSTDEPKYVCRSVGYTAEWQKPVYFLWQTFLVLILPSIFISYCYIKVARVVWRQGNPIIKMKLIPRKNKTINSNHFPNDNQQILQNKKEKKKQDFVEDNYSKSLNEENHLEESKTNNSSSNEDILLRKSDKQIEKFSKAKIRSIKLTFCIIVSFVGCWTPYFLVSNILIFNNNKLTNNEDKDCIIIMVINNIALLTSALNPFIYGYFSMNLMQNFRYRTASKDKILTLAQGSSQKESQITSIP